jgi:hypothetical protein
MLDTNNWYEYLWYNRNFNTNFYGITEKFILLEYECLSTSNSSKHKELAF